MENPDNPNKKLELVIKDSNLNPRQNILDNGILFDHLEKNKNIKKIYCTYKLAYDSLLCGLDKNKLEYKKNELTATRSIEKGEVKDKQYKKLIFGID